jgi:hypothetical protein
MYIVAGAIGFFFLLTGSPGIAIIFFVLSILIPRDGNLHWFWVVGFLITMFMISPLLFLAAMFFVLAYKSQKRI